MRPIATEPLLLILSLSPFSFLPGHPAAAQELDLSANVGWTSEYLYRGIPQKTSSASAGLDAGYGGAYLGTWAADVGDGAEVDVYGGVGAELGGLDLSVGGTGYFYTGGFDDTYLEANFGAGYGSLGVELSVGRYDTAPTPVEYWFLGVTAEHAGAYGTFGSFGRGFEGQYVEAGYGFPVLAELDLTVSWIYGTRTLLDGADDHTLVLGVGKTFTLR